jgi:hypothetical protein
MRPMRRLILALIVLGSCCAAPPAQATHVKIPTAPANPPQVVVFDIDGTLTPSPGDFLEVRPDAAKAAGLFASKGYEIVYLSARPPELRHATKKFLDHEKFPAGLLYVGKGLRDVRHPAEFKIRVLKQIKTKGWPLGLAYGDSTTDFEAYAKVGIPKEHVFALLRKHASSCQPGIFEECLPGWSEHLPFIEKQPAQGPGRTP